MVSKLKFPCCEIVKILFVVLLLYSLNATEANTSIKYCWKGTEDDVSGFTNVSCSTGASTPGQIMSAKLLPNSETESHTDTSSPVNHEEATNFHCMAFMYNETVTTGKETVVFAHTNYSCDTTNNCLGRNEPFEYTINNQIGRLYCCSSGDNCNTQALVRPEKHQHRCYSGSTQDYKVHLEVCPHKDMQCMKVTMREMQMDVSELKEIHQEFGCDTANVCQQEVEQQCTFVNKQSSGNATVQVETCCCKLSECYVPHWKPKSGNAVHTDEDTVLQKTLVIVIGVALGILVVGILLFYVRRSVQKSRRKQTTTGKNYSATVFRAVSKSDSEVLEEDRVQILPTS